MPRKLKRITLNEVSAVDIPADPKAMVTLFKRKGADMTDEMSPAQKAKMKEYMDKGYSKEEAMKMCKQGEPTTKGGHHMDPQELAEQLEALEVQVDDLTKRAEGAEADLEKAKTEVEDLKKQAEEVGFDISEEGKLTKRADPEYVEIEGERFEKSAIPAPVLKALAAKETELAKAKAEQESVTLAKRGKEELPHLAGTDLAKGKLLDMIDDDDIVAALKAADAALAKQMEEIGRNPLNNEASASFRLNKMAEDFAKENKMPYETAFAEVTKSGEGRDLMHEARSESH